ncbi:ABC transporter substrate-binding protein [Brevibacillus sp. B_LB10_24]|uniref:ABC transporter substrate-binding protein n=1 Tax=Brevibacillus sp. B_LB10_24 TaxID=3380645 RepID=UPI0038BC16C2
MKKYHKPVLAAILSAMVMLAGCSSSNAPGDSAAAGQGQTQGEKILVIGRGGDTVTLDPAQSSDDETNRVTEEVVETLVTYKKGTSEIVPLLAKSWQISEDGKTVTFHLEEGVKFHDGTPFNADAVVYNFERWWDPDHPYHNGAFSIFQTDMGGFKGDEKSVIRGVKKVDENTVEVSLAHSFAPFIAMLTEPQYSIVSPESMKKNNGEFKDQLVGTGAFQFVSWAPNDKIVLKKNPEYRVSGLPKVDQLVFQVIKDNSARLNALKTGQIDLMEGVSPSDVESLKSDPNLEVYTSPSNNVGYMAFNTQMKPFDNPKVRQAISMTIDKQGLIDAFYYGQAEPAVTVLPSKSWALNTDLETYPNDLEKAKQLLAEAGYPDGFKTELWVMPVARPYMPQPEKIGAALQANMKQIGIDAKIVTYDWATYIKKTNNGEAPMCLLGWSAATWDPTTLMYTLLHSTDAKPTNNVSLYKNPEVDELLDKALQVNDQAERAKLYNKAQELIYNDAPMNPLVHSTPVRAASKSVAGYVPQVTYGPQLTDVDIVK